MQTIKTVEQFVATLGVSSAEAAILMTSVGRYISMKGRPDNIKQLAGNLQKLIGDTRPLLASQKIEGEI